MDNGAETWWEKQVGCRGPFLGTAHENASAPMELVHESIIDL